MKIEQISVVVHASRRWTDSGVDVVAGERWRLVSSGEWTDWRIKCDAAGFDEPRLRLFEPLRRLPTAPWFGLVASIDKTRHTFTYVGREADLVPARSGRLYLFANDVAGMYWNNSGCVETRLSRGISFDGGAS